MVQFGLSCSTSTDVPCSATFMVRNKVELLLLEFYLFTLLLSVGFRSVILLFNSLLGMQEASGNQLSLCGGCFAFLWRRHYKFLL